jgi:hypothetical protein
MIEFLLKETLPQYFDLNPDGVNVPIACYREPFTEVDAKACDEAAARERAEGIYNKFEQICKSCDHVVLKVDNNHQEITVVELEHYVNALPERIIAGQKRCDLLMTDGIPHHKIVFCDLCCYDEYYIGPNEGHHPEGKRAEARKKMADSVELLLGVDLLNHFILTFPEKVCLFAYRSYSTVRPTTAQRGRNNTESNMLAMLTTPSSISGRIETEEKVMNHHFTFVQNKYPNPYKW